MLRATAAPLMVKLTRPVRAHPMMKNVNEGKGIFATLIIATRNIIGKKRFNQFRANSKLIQQLWETGLLCGSDCLPHLIVNGDQGQWGEFITPGILFLYIAGWIGWVDRTYLIAIRDEKKPTQKEIIIDVPLANKLIWRGLSWPVAAYREYLNGELIDPNV